MNSPVSSATASTILMAGPAKAISRRCQRGLEVRAAGIGRAFVARLLAGHLHIAAEQDQGEPEVGLAALESEEPGPKAEAERLDFDVEKARREIVAEFVDQDHHPDQNQVPPDVLQDRAISR